jgi:biopolymer transport protein TolQ
MSVFLLTVPAPVTPPLETPVGGWFDAGPWLSLRNNLVAETFMQAGPVVKLVLALLIILSVICWGIILYKHLALRRAHRNTMKFLDIFSGASSLMEVHQAIQTIPSGPLQELFEAGYLELSRLLGSARSSGERPPAQDVSKLLGPGGTENVERAMIKAKTRVNTTMEKYLTFLATTGSTAPFIGLFGTVWGIMTAFRSIGTTGNANLATVAPGIAEALIATAVGLFAAIPAVVAYNFFLQQVRVLAKEMENFSTDLINLIERQLRKQAS